MLNTCDHDEIETVIVYEGVYCPLCHAEDEIRDLEARVIELEKQAE